MAKATGKSTGARKGATKAAPAKAAKRTAATKKTAAKKAAPAGKTCPLSGIFVPKQSANISPKTLEKLRELLVEERARHLQQSVELQADADMLVAEREQGDTQFDEESGEGDTISVERERDLMLSANARQAVDEIDRALERMKDGTYGLCVPAGRRINVARLEAIPWAEFCVDCKQRVERPRR
jgi:RNA polymerase-binding transcription factor DksA